MLSRVSSRPAALALLIVAGALLAGLLQFGVAGGLPPIEAAGAEPPFEVWTLDQQDTTDDGGGLLYIHEGPKLMGQAANAGYTKIDLGGAVRDLCKARTDSYPRRPHMITFNGGDYDTGPGGNTHALMSFVVSGHVVFFDAATRTPLECIDVGVQAHAIWPTPDQRHAIVADQNGRKLHRIATDYATNTFTLETTFDLAGCTTPSGAPCTTPLRDDNAPICPRVDASNRYTFATLRGGGLFVIDHNATPMRIVAEYDRSVIWTGCGAAEVGDKMYLNSGSLPGRLAGHDLYAFALSSFSLAGTPPNTPAPRLVYSRVSSQALDLDSHGVVLTKDKRYLWINDRIQNDVTVIDTESDTVVNRFSLIGQLSSDPAPDIFDLSPSGNRMFVTLRGPLPQSGGHAAFGNTPGIGVIQVLQNGRAGNLHGLVHLPNTRGSIPADPHGIRVRHLGP
jgi:DNA-binding beta-propeller fold protein YncE